jgi:hypothetical protein
MKNGSGGWVHNRTGRNKTDKIDKTEWDKYLNGSGNGCFLERPHPPVQNLFCLAVAGLFSGPEEESTTRPETPKINSRTNLFSNGGLKKFCKVVRTGLTSQFGQPIVVRCQPDGQLDFGNGKKQRLEIYRKPVSIMGEPTKESPLGRIDIGPDTDAGQLAKEVVRLLSKANQMFNLTAH